MLRIKQELNARMAPLQKRLRSCIRWQMAERDLSFLNSAEDLLQCKESVRWGGVGKNWREWQEDADVSGIFVYLSADHLSLASLEYFSIRKEEEIGLIFICFTTWEIHKWKPFFFPSKWYNYLIRQLLQLQQVHWNWACLTQRAPLLFLFGSR